MNKKYEVQKKCNTLFVNWSTGAHGTRVCANFTEEHVCVPFSGPISQNRREHLGFVRKTRDLRNKKVAA